MREPVTVIIADDHPMFRAGVRQSLENDPDIKLLGDAENGEQAFEKIQKLKPRVAILDVQMPVMTGLEVARRVEKLNLSTHVILLTMLDDRKFFLEAIDAGIKGYVLKDSAVSELKKAINAVCDDRHYISPSLAGLLVARKGPSPAPAQLRDLTPTEMRVLKLIAALKSNQEIADEMFISKRTVENHRVNMAKKLDLNGTNALLKFALSHQSQL
ncbi:MAG TPA: response regulator transcription factor [Bacteroidota bacterium]